MLFNSYLFILGFVPVTLILYFAVATRFGLKASLAFLAAASLIFYGWWSPRGLILLSASIIFNYTVGYWLAQTDGSRPSLMPRRLALTAALTINLGLLIYVKYANFFVDSVNDMTGSRFILAHIVLPLGISFFTFEQIGYLVDAYRGKAQAYGFVEYVFFVTFFPHLVAGPIIMHHDLLRQLRDRRVLHFSWANFATGITFFVIGLFKKAVVADCIAVYAAPTFAAVVQGGPMPTAFSAWLAVFAYSLQLYFDFSGYSDMAIGLAQMLNFKLPLNFDSPYKAANAIDFWRRWHMTLSRFLKDYLYIPLGGGRTQPWRRYMNLMITMVLGGLWHGAGWGFVVWGFCNGAFLVINHLWRALRGSRTENCGFWATQASTLLTFVLIVLSRVFFRTVDWHSAISMFQALGGAGGGGLTQGIEAQGHAVLFCLGAYAWTRLAPNSHDVLAHRNPVAPPHQTTNILRWGTSARWAALTAALGCVALLHLTKISEFLYFQF